MNTGRTEVVLERSDPDRHVHKAGRVSYSRLSVAVQLPADKLCRCLKPEFVRGTSDDGDKRRVSVGAYRGGVFCP